MLKVNASFKRLINTENTPSILATVKIECADNLNKATIMQKASGKNEHWSQREKKFKTATEAETWARTLCEKIKHEYTVAVARINALEVPNDFSEEY